MKPKILVAGIGNLFKADDAFGCEVARRLSERAPENRMDDSVSVVDFGIRGIDLAYALSDGIYDLVVLVDAIQRGGDPGTVYLIEPDLNNIDAASEGGTLGADSHGMHPARVLSWAKAMGAELPIVRLVGCEPEDIVAEEEDIRVGLTPRVALAVDPAMRLITRLTKEFVRAEEGVMRCTR
jgi:hydrogenase maturation protease